MFKLRRYNLTYTQMSAIGFMAIILLGAGLLALPIASRSGEATPFIDALFTSASATCVTGLVVYDTFTHFSVFGQVVILCLIQIGGLGFMAVAALFSLMLRRKIGLKERGFLKESVSTIQIGGVVRLTKHILIGTLIFEAIGAMLLTIRFASEMKITQALYNGVFHAVSAFCNAGFDLMGRFEPGSSLMRYSGDYLINFVIMALIIIGGIGFFVWEDLWINKWHFAKYHLHTKIVVVSTGLLIVIPALLFYVIERNNVLAGMNGMQGMLASLFQVVTPRTAGFNTVPISDLTEGASLLTMILMIIGGSPGSTAGGIKTTTLVVLILSFISSINHTEDLNIFKRRLEPGIEKKAYGVATTYLMGSIAAVLCICVMQPLPLKEVFFEVLSALSTVGMSMGITGQLNSMAKLMIAVVMFCGRVGSLSVALAFAEKKVTVPIRQPIEKIAI